VAFGVILASCFFACEIRGAELDSKSGFSNDDDGGGDFAFFFDNDLAFEEDQGYTSGLRFAWLSEGRQDAGSASDSDLTRHWGLSLTHYMYTPDNSFALIPPPGERQYAGWLGLGLSKHERRPGRLESWELSLGTSGRVALAEQIQSEFHGHFDGIHFRGWDSQVPAEMTLNLYYESRYRWAFFEGADEVSLADFFFNWGGALGNQRTELRVSAEVRFGWNLEEDFSNFRLSNTAYHHEGSFSKEASVYVLGGMGLSGVAHELSIDGPLFRDWESYNQREPLVHEFYYGMGFRYQETELIFSAVRRSAEIKNGAEKMQEFTSAVLRFPF